MPHKDEGSKGLNDARGSCGGGGEANQLTVTDSDQQTRDRARKIAHTFWLFGLVGWLCIIQSVAIIEIQRTGERWVHAIIIFPSMPNSFSRNSSYIHSLLTNINNLTCKVWCQYFLIRTTTQISTTTRHKKTHFMDCELVVVVIAFQTVLPLCADIIVVQYEGFVLPHTALINKKKKERTKGGFSLARKARLVVQKCLTMAGLYRKYHHDKWHGGLPLSAKKGVLFVSVILYCPFNEVLLTLKRLQLFHPPNVTNI